MPDGVVYERKSMTISIDEYHDLVYSLGHMTAELDMWKNKYYIEAQRVAELKSEAEVLRA